MDNHQITELPNGLKVLTIDFPHLRTVSTSVFIKVGSRYEPITLNGLAHFLEHMIFKGTKKRSVFQIANEIERVGSSTNAFTSKEITAFYANSLATHTELSLDILSDILLNSQFPQNELDTERGVVIQEINRSLDNPGRIAYDNYAETAYSSQAFGRKVLGTPEIIASVDRNDFFDYVDLHYRANNMIVVGAGKVDHTKFVELVSQYFSSVLPAKSRPTPEKVSYSGGCTHYNKNFEQATIMFGFEAPNVMTDEYLVVNLLADVLGGGMSSPLFTEVREKRGLVYSVNSMSHNGEDYGDFLISAGTTTDHLPEFFDVSCNELLKLTDNISEEDIFRAKNAQKTQLLQILEYPFQLGMNAVTDIFAFGKIRDFDDLAEIIDSITTTQLKETAKKIFSGKPTLSIVGPVDKDINEYYDTICKKFA